jgi:hypothetical protein
LIEELFHGEESGHGLDVVSASGSVECSKMHGLKRVSVAYPVPPPICKQRLSVRVP